MALPDLTDIFIADAYRGVIHTSNTPVSETNLPPLYDGLGNKTSIKIGKDGNGASISGCLSADCVVVGNVSLVDYIFPIGSIHLSIDDINPSLRFTGTTWVKVSDGKFLAGVGTGTDKNAAYATITSGNDSSTGEYQHTLSVNEIPPHSHQFPVYRDSSSDGGNIQAGTGSFLVNASTINTGGGLAHNNIPPYFGIYVWKRTA